MRFLQSKLARDWRPKASRIWSRSWAKWIRADVAEVGPPARFVPSIRPLEKRLVLNATAELTALGDLLVQGDAGFDTIESSLTPTGELQFTDSVTGIIPITIGHDVIGNPIQVDSIGVDAITGGRVRVNLGGGNDSLHLRLPDGLDATVRGGLGKDSVDVEVLSPSTIGNDVDVAAEMISVRGNANTSFALLPELGMSVVNITELTTEDVGRVDLGEATTTVQDRVQLLGLQDDLVLESSLTTPVLEVTGQGAVRQLVTSTLVVDDLDVSADAGVTLNQTSNQISNVRILTADADVQLVSQSDLIVQQINAGDARVEVFANSINDSADDNLADFIADELLLEANDGIGNVQELELQSVTQLDVDAGDGNVDLVWMAVDEPVVARIDFGSGDFRLEQNGGLDLTLERVMVDQGSIWVRNDGNIIINDVVAGDGYVDVHAEGDLILVDDETTDDGPDRKLDPEVVALGTDGRVRLTSDQRIVASDNVQIQAASIESGAVTLSAPAIELGQQFEINTGNGVGIARQFTPRPELDPEDLVPPNPDLPPRPAAPPVAPEPGELTEAFYQHDSIRTNILSQFDVNDAEGILSVNLGTEGENGLTLIIDWGADTDRFQRVENLPGSFQTTSVSHVYMENDILESTLNGRGSATDPLNVLFAVEHHESIVLLGESIAQPNTDGSLVSMDVPGNVISSTDNPLTQTAAGPVLESGAAFFVIPRVNVPLAFLPIRDVIPEPVDPVTPVVTTTTTTLTSVTFETSEASSSPASIREEFFQLRALSPDPDAEDLIEPVRLPDRSLESDSLNRLFSKLPDGEYEIQYVIGESDERTILQVELRDGRPIQTGDDLEAGTLRLIPLDLEELDSDQLPNEERDHDE
ncbi:hypothetical protein [Rhodopirellula bahusiensis]|uniref:Uncharacterized protein n=1 Tax=Rhodopirellula bahusiensis TaxID=2014065 RepID=A0A2G1WB94_9BACT|nr:hypothetical protein [Rhodopirellula bahusiensis]PHQ36291.1 hypothetical protein CEE69_06495 [Rhodopirellula bahusiensis]